MKIDIEIDDISLFAQVAVIIDKPEIQKGIVQLRQKWTKGKLYPDLKSWEDEGIKINFHKDILDYLNNNQVSPVFLSVIEEAIITNRVTHFTRVIRVPIPHNVLSEYILLSDETLQNANYEYVLIAPAEAERNEVEEEYASMKRAIKNTAKLDSPFEVLIQPITQNPKTSFRNAREWYWMYQKEKENGKGIYPRILETWEKIYPPKNSDDYLDQNVIEQAVSRYHKLIER
jgi:hypothetical protein